MQYEIGNSLAISAIETPSDARRAAARGGGIIRYASHDALSSRIDYLFQGTLWLMVIDGSAIIAVLLNEACGADRPGDRDQFAAPEVSGKSAESLYRNRELQGRSRRAGA
jgi:hypothetical protein